MTTMNITFIEARDLNEAWFLCVKEASLNGREYVVQKGSFEQTKRREISLVCVQVNYPNTRPLSPVVPEGIPPVATEENIQQYLLYLMTSTKQSGEEYTYGEDLEPQIPEVIRRYREWGSDTNRLCMTVGSKDSLFEYRREEQTGQKASSQCLRLIDTRIQGGELHFIVYFRSWDLWAGFPVNMGGLQLLKEYMASEIGVSDGKLIAFSKGLHLYGHTFELAEALTKRGRFDVEKCVVDKAIRFFGTGKVMVYGPEDTKLSVLQGRRYSEVKDAVLSLANEQTEFCHHIPSEDPNNPVRKMRVSREEW